MVQLPVPAEKTPFFRNRRTIIPLINLFIDKDDHKYIAKIIIIDTRQNIYYSLFV